MLPILADVNVWLPTLVADHPHQAGGHRFATFDRGFLRFDGLDVLMLGASGDARDRHAR